MSKDYLYNEKTRTLHIKGYCWHTAGYCADYISFDSEKNALAYDGRSVSVCKLCQKKIEQMIKGKK